MRRGSIEGWAWVIVQRFLWAVIAVSLAVHLVSIMLGRGVWTSAAAILLVLSIIVNAVTTKRARRSWENAGEWREREYVLHSMSEATARGLTPEQWVVGYVERVSAMTADLPLPNKSNEAQ